MSESEETPVVTDANTDDAGETASESENGQPKGGFQGNEEYTTEEEDGETDGGFSQGNPRSRAGAKGQNTARSNNSEKFQCSSEKVQRVIQKKAEMRASRWEDPSNPIRRREYLKHRTRILTAKSLVDSSSPLANKNLYTSQSYNQRVMEFSRIERENTIMLQHLANIIHGKGSIDNKWDRPIRAGVNRGQSRQMKLLRITFDNLSLLKRIQSIRPNYSRKEQLKDYRRMEDVMEQLSFYPLYWHVQDSCKWGPFENRAKANAQARGRARCFLELGNQNETIGKIMIDVFASECPMTAENFRGLCTGEYGLSYKCSTIHRIIPDILWQGGDVTGQGGSGNKSIYGDTFPDEKSKLKHDKAGTVSMANCGPNTNGSQFIIAAKALAVLDGANIVFGQVVGGMGILKKLYENLAPSGRPKKKFWITNCGETDPDGEIPPEDGEGEEEENPEEEEPVEGEALPEQNGADANANPTSDGEDEYEEEDGETTTISEPTTIMTEESDGGKNNDGAENTS